MIHLYAAPGEFPDTLCPANRAWKHLERAVYLCDLDEVDCPDCLAIHRRSMPSWQCRECGHSRGYHLHEATCGHEDAHDFDGSDVAGLMNTYSAVQP